MYITIGARLSFTISKIVFINRKKNEKRHM